MTLLLPIVALLAALSVAHCTIRHQGAELHRLQRQLDIADTTGERLVIQLEAARQEVIDGRIRLSVATHHNETLARRLDEAGVPYLEDK